MCTTLMLKTKTDTKQAAAVVSGRTMEFGFDVASQIMVIPAGTTLNPTLLGDSKIANSIKPGTPYVTQYGMVGANALGMDVIVDGINDQGLYFSALYFPGYAQYGHEAQAVEHDVILAPYDLGAWILGNCQNVHGVLEKMGHMLLVGTVVPELNGPPPLHFIVRDPSGESVVIEPVEGGLKLYPNPVGVLTNSPPFDWHMLNLINYRGLQPENTASVVLGGGHELPLFGQGSGMVGLPGDSTPVSRFVRAVAFAQTAVPPPDAHEAVLQMFHIMNNFDIPVGSVTDTHVAGDGTKTIHRDYTIWTTAADLTNGHFYYRTYNDQSIRMIDVAHSLKAARGDVRRIEMDSQQTITDVTTKFMTSARPA